MDSQSFNIPQFNSMIENALKGYEQEKQKLENEHKILIDKIDLLNWAKNCVATIQHNLSDAYKQINSQEEEIENLNHQLQEEREKQKKDELIVAQATDISKQNQILLSKLSVFTKKLDRTVKELQEEKEQNDILKMQIHETKKLSEGLAQKTSDENLIKALRRYVNSSKRKSPAKRAFVKEAVTEIVLQNNITLPEDLIADIDSLDDEQSDQKSLTVKGDYYDIHNNGEVNQK